MSSEQKQQMGEAITWILRVLTAAGAFFLIQTYGLMKDTNKLLQTHLIQYAAESRETSIRIGVMENELKRYRDERDKRTHYYDQQPAND
jgi:cytochrome c-type biogenesis protein CcmE